MFTPSIKKYPYNNILNNILFVSSFAIVRKRKYVVIIKILSNLILKENFFLFKKN